MRFEKALEKVVKNLAKDAEEIEMKVVDHTDNTNELFYDGDPYKCLLISFVYKREERPTEDSHEDPS